MGNVTVLELDVLVQRTLRTVGLLALLVRANVVAGDLTSSPSHTLLLLFGALTVFRVRVVLRRHVVGMWFQAAYNPQLELSVAFLG